MKRKHTFSGIATENTPNSVAITNLKDGQETHFALDSYQTFPYKLASLSDAKGDIKKRWHVSFYVWNKLDKELQRKRLFISQKLKTRAARYREADRLIKEINRLLKTGYVIGKKVEQKQKPIVYLSFLEAFQWVQKSRKDVVRPKSLKSFEIILHLLEIYIKKKKLLRFPVNMVDMEMCEDFMSDIKATRGISNNTYNNYLIYFKGYFYYMVKKGRLTGNPAEKMKPLPKTESEVVSFPKVVRQKLMDAYKEENPGLHVFAQYIFYSFIRPAELRLLKVSHILAETIYIPGNISKNRKSEHVLISPGMRTLIESLGVMEFPPSYYLIGKNGKPSLSPMPVNYFNQKHLDIRRKLELDECYKLYCWKHTGVVEMYQATKDLEFVSRHCRHSSLDMTKNYLRGLGLMIDYRIMSKLPVFSI